MPASACEYAVIRVVPRVERGEFINVGVLLLCRQRRFLAVCLRPDEARLRALAPELDHAALAQQLDLLPLICAGGPGAGPIGTLPPHERFRWLTAPRSTIVQCSPVHVGLYADPQAALERICRQMVG
jgi:hypothetical protein